MITAITFSFSYNRKFLNKELHPTHLYGNKYTTDLEALISDEVKLLTNLHQIVNKLNKNLAGANVVETILSVYPNKENHIRITNHTKSKRTYSFAGLTIHEEDK